MKILVCGGRDYSDKEKVKSVLLEINPKCVIQGGAPGADSLAKEVAIHASIECIEYKADWKKYGKRAGPIRNRQMLDENPDIELIVAFHENIESSKGTKDMVTYAKTKGYKVRIES